MLTRSRGANCELLFFSDIEKHIREQKKNKKKMSNDVVVNEQEPDQQIVDQVTRTRKPLYDYVTPPVDEHDSVIPPEVNMNQFEIKPAIIHMVSNDQFGGAPTEDPNNHITKFLRACNTFKINGVPSDAVRLRLFPFSLRDRAQSWLDSFPDNHFSTWDQLHGEFLKRFFPPSKTAKIRRMIQNFKQNPNEPLYEAWERFKDLQRQCPHHNIQNWHLMTAFYEGLSENSRILVDASANGSFMCLELEEAEELMERISSNGSTWYSERSSAPPKIGGMYEVDQMSAITTKVDNMMTLIQKMAQVSLVQNSAPTPPPAPVLMCESCGGQHNQSTCPWESMEQVDYVKYNRQPQQNQFGNFNPQGRNHPGFSWSNQNGAANPQPSYRSAPPGFQNQQQQFRGGQGIVNQPQYKPTQNLPYPSNQQQKPLLPTPETAQTPVLENIVDQLLKSQLSQAETLKQITEELGQLRAHNRMLENQIANQASTSSTKVTGKLPACPENPREQMNVVTTRSGKQHQSLPLSNDEQEHEVLEEGIVQQQKGGNNNNEHDVGTMPKSTDDHEGSKKQRESPVRKYIPPVPYPNRLKKANMEERRTKFLNVIKQLDISIPLLDAITEIPSYAKFLKDILTKKKENPATVAMSQECSAIIQNKITPKLCDPGSFSIPCTIGGSKVNKALCDLGASVSLIPYSLCQKLHLGDPKPTTMALQLADRSVKYPIGILEDVPVKIDKYYIPGDFVVLDMEEDARVPVILGRPFLATAGAIINVKKGTLILEIGDDKIEFNVRELSKDTPCVLDGYYADVIDSCTTNTFDESYSLSKDPMEYTIRESIADEQANEMVNLCLEMLQNISLPMPKALKFEVLNLEDQSLNVKGKAPEVELKPLPSTLKYAFLGPDSTYPVIVNADLDLQQVERLLQVLRSHRRVIGYTIDDIVGIKASYCMHRIYLEDDHKPSIEHQRRLNPNMKDVVKKEILKLLSSGIIFPISDSKWVSPIHVVPKKGGITVVKNDKNELIPTRIVTGWRMCIDYRKLNKATRKDHFPLPFIDQLLERMAKHKYFCFLDGFSGFFQIPIHPDDQEMTTFTCPYGTFAYRRMPFGLCNAPGTFQRCMLAIFSDLVEEIMEVFMDDFSVYGISFDDCLENLEKVLSKCEEANLILNWEKCHFMATEGIVLGHKISEKGIEVDPAKIEVIEKLPPPSSIKGIRSFLGHAGFYRRFIKDFSKISKPLTNLLSKDVEFNFDESCCTAFSKLKLALTTAPIIRPPDWNLPFELMCDASDYAVGAILGQRKGKEIYAIYYASHTLDDAQSNYATTEKEFLAIIFAIEKF
ncbi:unnamed protein product [Cuscuta epithymum]|uniref:Reverse transcriptase domain-containing protein n=1 Tax=Cuscuta epithymum TaxID=186058 RepID=A0AAV0G134_9ASTE|nr:unnamed protein product [Cuscuta epithymum]